jgi:hypothetical protein
MSGVRELNLNKYLVQTSTMHENHELGDILEHTRVKKNHHKPVNTDNRNREADKEKKRARDKKYHHMYHVHDDLCNS